MFENTLSFIRETFNEPKGFIPLHAPYFGGNEKKYLADTIDSTFVSSVGEYVNRFEEMLCAFTGAKYAIAITNGTTALHLALIIAGVSHNDEVITQPLTFVATSNAIAHCGANPVYVDVDIDTMGMSPASLESFLEQNTIIKDGLLYNKLTGRRIKACVPMHTFGFPCRIDEIAAICERYQLVLVEDAAESLGSYYKGIHTGNSGAMGVLSFNGNKTITCGGGGALLTNDEALAKKAKHLSTTAKVPHSWEFAHDAVGYNYRMPNVNAALGCAQMEKLPEILANKQVLAATYNRYFNNGPVRFVSGILHAQPNYWLNTILLKDEAEREQFLKETNETGIMTRPAWKLMHTLPMYRSCERTELTNAVELEKRAVNLPSSFRTNV